MAKYRCPICGANHKDSPHQCRLCGAVMDGTVELPASNTTTDPTGDDQEEGHRQLRPDRRSSPSLVIAVLAIVLGFTNGDLSAGRSATGSRSCARTTTAG